jgi:hypothetical protein
VGNRIVIKYPDKPTAHLVPDWPQDSDAASHALERLFAQSDAMADAGIRFTHEDLIAMRDEGRR